MREVATVIKIQSHEGVAWLEYCEQYCSVGLGSRVWLHVSKLSTKELLHTVACEVLHLVNNLTATIIALAGKSLSILVGEV